MASEQLDAAAQLTPEDIAAAQEFWSRWGTPLLNAMLNAKAEPLPDGGVTRTFSGTSPRPLVP